MRDAFSLWIFRSGPLAWQLVLPGCSPGQFVAPSDRGSSRICHYLKGSISIVDLMQTGSFYSVGCQHIRNSQAPSGDEIWEGLSNAFFGVELTPDFAIGEILCKNA